MPYALGCVRMLGQNIFTVNFVVNCMRLAEKIAESLDELQPNCAAQAKKKKKFRGWQRHDSLYSALLCL